MRVKGFGGIKIFGLQLQTIKNRERQASPSKYKSRILNYPEFYRRRRRWRLGASGRRRPAWRIKPSGIVSVFEEICDQVVDAGEAHSRAQLCLHLRLQDVGYELLAEIAAGVGGAKGGAVFDLCEIHLILRCRSRYKILSRSRRAARESVGLQKGLDQEAAVLGELTAGQLVHRFGLECDDEEGEITEEVAVRSRRPDLAEVGEGSVDTILLGRCRGSSAL